MALFNKAPNVQLTKSFSDSASKLNKDTIVKVAAVPEKLFEGTNAKGLNLEPVKSAVKDVYSIRVDDRYRIILLYPSEERNLYIFLYVDMHDKAYKWAEKFRYEINEYGSFQNYVAAPEKSTASKQIAKLAAVSDDQFRLLEVSDKYWESLRERTFIIKQLECYKGFIPEATMLVLSAVIEDAASVDQIEELYNQLNEKPDLTPPDPLFLNFSNSDLAKVGVPEEYIETVKKLNFKSELSNLQNKLPEDAVQGLYSLLSGEPLDDIIKMAKTKSEPTDSIKKSLNNYNSKSSVVQVTTKEELEKILEYPMEKWRIFLHPQQREHAYRSYNGAARILGGGGTGKTVVSVHHAKFLAQESKSNRKILVTTFNKTLAADIEKRLKMICSESEFAKLEVKTVDKLAYDIIKSENYRIKYENDKEYRDGPKILETIWDYARNRVSSSDKFDYEFLKDEWSYVIQGQNIKTKAEYLKAPRTGRGKPLNQREREIVWAICEQYLKQLEEKKYLDIDLAENKIAELAASNSKLRVYDSIIVDECQDLRAPALRMLRALAGEPHRDDLFLAGDTRQSIYNSIKVKLSQCNITVNNRSTVLKLNYRTTAEIYDLAYKLQQDYEYDDLDGTETDRDKSVCVYHGDEPVIKGFLRESAEMSAVFQDIRKKLAAGFSAEEICIVAKTYRSAENWKNELEQAGFEVLQLKNNVSDDKSVPGIRVATMYRVKGMEFDCMYVVGVNLGVLPSNTDVEKAVGEEEIHAVQKQAANLLHVAITRARKCAWISYNGQPSEFIDVLMSD